MDIPIVICKEAGSVYGVSVPDIKGVHSWGYTVEAALENVKDAITTHIETLLQLGEPVEIRKSTIESLQQNPDLAGGIWALVHLDLENWIDNDPKAITLQSGEPVVMLSLADFNSIEETLHLLGSPNNTKRLMESFEQFKAGKSQKRQLIRCNKKAGKQQKTD